MDTNKHTGKTSLIDYAALATDVRFEQHKRGVELKQIAAEAGVDGSKLSNLLNLKGGLSTDNLLLICDWLGKNLYDYRRSEMPDWLVKRLATANRVDADTARELAERRSQAAKSYAKIPPIEDVIARANARLHASEGSMRGVSGR